MALFDTIRRFFHLSCAEVNRFIIDYLENDLDARTRRRFEQHLALCPLCQLYFEQYRETVALAREAGADAPTPPPELVEATLAFLREHLDAASGDGA